MNSQPGLMSVIQKSALVFKLGFIGFLILVLLIPMSMIGDLIREREASSSEAENEIMGTWGGPQVVGGPVVSVPCTLVENKKTWIVWTHFLPETVAYDGHLTPKMLNRGIFQVPVYDGELHVSGAFAKPNVLALVPDADKIMWEKAVISFGVSFPRSIRDAFQMQWGNQSLTFGPGGGNLEFLGSHVQAKLPDMNQVSGDETIPWSVDLKLAGGKSLSFLPLGKQTRASLSSSWTNPGFGGAYLPEHRELGKDGFKANWSVLYLGRNHPQQWRSDMNAVQYLDGNAFGVDLLLPVDIYTMSDRSVKYASLFIFLTFTAFFLFEILNRMRIHPFQYMMVGLALCIFYLLLLSLSEQLPFGLAYVLASGAITIMVTGYSASVLKQRRRAAVMAVLLMGIYGFLFVLLQLSELALLLGSLGLFAIMALVMMLTRNLDWYAWSQPETAHPEQA